MPDVIRAKRVELIDPQGAVRAAFELEKYGDGTVSPRLVFRDGDGRDSVELAVNGRGDGELAFANDYWNSGAIVLGRLGTVDDGTQSMSKDVEDKNGAWGLSVRSRNSQFTTIGYTNTGKVIVPRSLEAARK